ncbi:MAG TPA: PHB depolymerase family esterase [Polyangiaceae bacterium]|jgi:polyhydroxybutyrate depolymerase|nr:PHB depolymerase family esterase [Polyangiaceae bacterium]
MAQSSFRRVASLLGAAFGASVSALPACMPMDDLSSYSGGESAEGAAAPLAHPVAQGDASGTSSRTSDVAPAAGSAADELGGPSAALRSREAPPPEVPASRPGVADPACPTPSSAAVPDACPRHRGAVRGESVQTVTVAGDLRSFIYYAPETLDPELPAPLLILAHGRSVGASELLAISELEKLADRAGFLLLAPDGQRPDPWNIGRGNCAAETGRIPSAPGDDAAFLDAMLAFVSADRALDVGHVFLAGFGAGGYWASETACRRPLLRGFAAHSAGSHSLADCSSERTPAILFHGLRDPVVAPDCGRETRARWAERNGCSQQVEARPVLGGVCEYSTDCPEGGQVVLCLFDDLGSAWAGGIGQNGADPAQFASASELSWEFFKSYAW